MGTFLDSIVSSFCGTKACRVEVEIFLLLHLYRLQYIGTFYNLLIVPNTCEDYEILARYHSWQCGAPREHQQRTLCVHSWLYADPSLYFQL